MSLYLVNTRPAQDCRFFYRLPEQPSPMPAYLDLRMGEQRQLPEPPGGLSEQAVLAIVHENERYGMREAGKGLPPGQCVPMLWSRSPISEKSILSTVEHNQKITRVSSVRRLDAAAVAIANSIDEGLHRAQMPDRLRVLDATIQEEGEGAEADLNARVQRTPAQREAGEYRRRNSRRRTSE